MYYRPSKEEELENQLGWENLSQAQARLEVLKNRPSHDFTVGEIAFICNPTGKFDFWTLDIIDKIEKLWYMKRGY